jgi:hypothetical protein
MEREALKLALEAHRKDERHHTVAETRYWCNQYKLLAHQAIEALAQQAQEPVAWMRPSEEGYDSAFRDHSTVVVCTGNPWTGWIPLYTAPPQRTWVDLTEEQIEACWNKDLWKAQQPHNIFASAVLAKSKEKNNVVT